MGVSIAIARPSETIFLKFVSQYRVHLVCSESPKDYSSVLLIVCIIIGMFALMHCPSSHMERSHEYTDTILPLNVTYSRVVNLFIILFYFDISERDLEIQNINLHFVGRFRKCYDSRSGYINFIIYVKRNINYASNMY